MEKGGTKDRRKTYDALEALTPRPSYIVEPEGLPSLGKGNRCRKGEESVVEKRDDREMLSSRY